MLTTNPGRSALPKGMTAVKGDLLDPASLRDAFEGVQTMFLLASVSPSELTQSLLALDLAYEAGVEHVVYFSQIKLDWPDCPHAVAKSGAEALIRHHGLSATILRPAYFYQNEVALKEPIMGGTYPIPIGKVGAQMVDIRDIAEVAALAILDRDRIGSDRIVELVGPDVITGERAAETWTNVTGRHVSYGGDALGEGFEQSQTTIMPGWQAHDLVAMFRGCQREGMIGKPGAVDRLTELLGRPLRSYEDFTRDTFQEWQER